MASISSMISFVVLLLATYSYSAPVVPDLQNATSPTQVENATIDFHPENIVILARRDTSDVAQEKHGDDTVGLSSSSSEDETVQTTDSPSPRDFEDTSFPSSSETNEKRDANTESFDDGENERSFTEDSLSTEMNTKRGIEVQSFESSTDDDTSVAPSHQVESAKRSMDNSQWLSDSSSWLSANSNDNAERMKRSMDNGQWLSDSSSWLSANSNDNAEHMKRSMDNGQWLRDELLGDAQKRSFEDVTFSADEDTSVPSTSDITNTRRDMEQLSSFPAEENEQFNQRAIRPMKSSSKTLPVTRNMQRSSSSLNQRSKQFNQRAIGSVESGESSTIVAAKIQSESTTDEQPSASTTEIIRDQISSTSDYETTVAPVEHFTTPSSVTDESKSKILAVIPGQISRSQLVINPATGTTAGFRPMKQVHLSQGKNETVVEEKKPNY